MQRGPGHSWYPGGVVYLTVIVVDRCVMQGGARSFIEMPESEYGAVTHTPTAIAQYIRAVCINPCKGYRTVADGYGGRTFPVDRYCAGFAYILHRNRTGVP